MIIRHDANLCTWAVVQGCRQYGILGRYHLAQIDRVVGRGECGLWHYVIHAHTIEGSFETAFAACTWAELELDAHVYCSPALLNS
jgi:hypothetical protein